VAYEFFTEHPVFTTEEFKGFRATLGTPGPRAAESLLGYYQKKGRIVRAKRGLYVVFPPGNRADSFVPDPFLLASRMSHDAVLVHHTALEFHGRAHSVFERFTYQTGTSPRPLSFRNWKFQPVSVPGALQKQGREDFGVITVERNGMDVRVASLERTLVDVLSRSVYSGSWEEIWRSLESVEFFDLEQVVEYVLLLANASATAKVGFFLEQHRERLFVEEQHLEPLRKMRPGRPLYLNRGKRKNSRLVKAWNLMVPDEILNRSWAEIL